MIKTLSFLGVAVLAALIIVGFSGSQNFGDVAARERQADTCHVQDVALDEGYGISRTIAGLACPE